MTKFLNISTDNTLGGNSPSDDVVSSQKAIATKIGTKQDTLVSGTNIKTINNQSILGSGNIDVSGTGSGYHPGILSWEWDDHLREDMSWLRGDTFSWQDGTVYEAAYQHLLDEFNALAETVWWVVIRNVGNWYRNTSKDQTGADHPYAFTTYYGTYPVYSDVEQPTVGATLYDGYSSGAAAIGNITGATENIVRWAEYEIVAGVPIAYYLAADGHKICTAESENSVASIYATTGVAWYYVLDTTNTRFKLPRAKHAKYAATLGVVGNGMSLGITNGSVNGGLDGNPNYAVYVREGNYGKSVGAAASGTTITNILGVTTDPDNSGIVAQQAEETDQYKYLYFYVGNFTQSALENTAGLNAELFNGKADVSTVAHVVTEFQAPTAGNNYTWYRKYADGWVEQGGVVNTAVTSPNIINLPVAMADANYTPIGLVQSGSNGTGGYTSEGWAERTTTSFKVYGHAASAAITNAYSWMVFGMAA